MSPSSGGRHYVIMIVFILIIEIDIFYSDEGSYKIGRQENLVILLSSNNEVADVTVFVNERVILICNTMSNRSLPSWSVDDIFIFITPNIDERLVPQLNSAEGGFALSIYAISSHNGSNFQCFDGDRNAGNKRIIMQGPPLAVTNLRSNYVVDNSVTINWTAPFSLDVTGVEPDIWYSVIIYNMTDENNPTIINCTDCINITDTHYIFTPKSNSVYNVSILSLNGAGQADSSPSICVEELHLTGITANENGDVAVQFNTQCFGLNASFYSGDVKYEGLFVEDDIVSFTLPPNKLFSIGSIEFVHAEGMTQFSLPEYFTTFDVQRISLNPVGGSQINITVDLINGSRSIGFLVVVESTTAGVLFFAVPTYGSKKVFSDVIHLPPSHYSIYIHDLDENGLPSTAPAHPYSFKATVDGPYNESWMYENATCASFFRNCSHLAVMCKATGQSNDTSCIIVYRAHGNPMLNLIQNKAVSLDFSSETVNYTVVVFKSFHHGIEERPCASTFVTHTHCKISSMELKMMQTPSLSSLPTDNPESEGSKHVVVFVYSGAAVFTVALSVAIVLLIILVMIRKNVKSGNKAATRAVECDKEAEYEEIDLPVAITSSVIDTQPNTAYVTTTLSHPSTAINTTDNVAYGRI